MASTDTPLIKAAKDGCYSRKYYDCNGGETEFSFPFDYIDKEHISVIKNSDTDNPITSFEWLADKEIRLSNAVEAGDEILIMRTTPINERIVIFTNNNILDEEQQNISAEQVFFVVQEIRDSQNILVAQMQAFIELRDVIYDVLARLEEIDEAAQLAANYLTETYNLLSEFSDGVKCSVPHNLFELAVYDKTLSGTELDGWAAQGSTQNQSVYSSAYAALLNEFETGTKTNYYSADNLVTYHEYKAGDTTFYTAADTVLDEDITVYSNNTCSTSLGTVTELQDVSTVKYNANGYGDFYISTATVFGTGITVYSDKNLLTSLGVITDLKKSQSVYKYTLSTTGTVYTNGALANGRVLYSDAALNTQIGTVTAYGAVEADRYVIKGASFSQFYVPKGTLIQTGTTLYSDPACTTALGTISSRTIGVVASAQQYKVNLVMAGTLFNFTGVLPSPFYTASKLGSSSKNVVMYTNSARSSTSYKTSAGTSANNAKLLARRADKDNQYGMCFTCTFSGADTNNTLFAWVEYEKQINASTSKTYYYTIGTSTTKCTITYTETVSSVRVKVDNGANQSYNTLGVSTPDLIKIGDGLWQSYSKIGTDNAKNIKIGSGSLVALQDKGIGSTSGFAFEYSLASNGHKIVDSVYADKVTTYKTNNDGISDFYILNQGEAKFTLPTLDPDKKIYFCVGNTVIKPAAITGVTTAYLDEVLKDYFKTDGSDFTEILQMVQDFYNITGSINDALTEILGED